MSNAEWALQETAGQKCFQGMMPWTGCYAGGWRALGQRRWEGLGRALRYRSRGSKESRIASRLEDAIGTDWPESKHVGQKGTLLSLTPVRVSSIETLFAFPSTIIIVPWPPRCAFPCNMKVISKWGPIMLMPPFCRSRKQVVEVLLRARVFLCTHVAWKGRDRISFKCWKGAFWNWLQGFCFERALAENMSVYVENGCIFCSFYSMV